MHRASATPLGCPDHYCALLDMPRIAHAPASSQPCCARFTAAHRQPRRGRGRASDLQVPGLDSCSKHPRAAAAAGAASAEPLHGVSSTHTSGGCSAWCG
eukprot:366000-Chlamydomonas_euryale.AAC.53